tara:strand:+ start:6850 stop:7779 length:930 start_codon:yes stop_codon:yes gene_type:complete
MDSKDRLSPYSILRYKIENELDNLDIDDTKKLELIKQIPSRWEKLGDMVLIPENSLNSEIWNEVLLISNKNIWKIFCDVLGVSKIGRQNRIKLGPMRKSQVELLYGEDGIVIHKENGIIFEFDTTRVMFSSGNVSERIRMSKFDCSDEIVLDLYAGIGYYTLPLLVHANTKFLHACELNSDSIHELKKNLNHNGVLDKCIIHEGNNISILSNPNILGGIDRVMLGLLPSSKKGWNLAIQALNPKGGMLHLHGNSIAKEEKKWAEEVIAELEKISEDSNRHFKFKLEHIEKVKSYAPKINHVVLDISVST